MNESTDSWWTVCPKSVNSMNSMRVFGLKSRMMNRGIWTHLKSFCNFHRHLSATEEDDFNNNYFDYYRMNSNSMHIFSSHHIHNCSSFTIECCWKIPIECIVFHTDSLKSIRQLNKLEFVNECSFWRNAYNGLVIDFGSNKRARSYSNRWKMNNDDPEKRKNANYKVNVPKQIDQMPIAQKTITVQLLFASENDWSADQTQLCWLKYAYAFLFTFHFVYLLRHYRRRCARDLKRSFGVIWGAPWYVYHKSVSNELEE